MNSLVAFIIVIQLCQPPGIHIGQCKVGTSNYLYYDLSQCENEAKNEAVRKSKKGFVVITSECRPLIVNAREV
jgi:hypothetical protein